MRAVMSATQSIHTIVRDIVRVHAARGVAFDELSHDAPLGADGLGLDSIAIAEVLLDCQQRFGVSVMELLEQEPLTLRRLVQHLEQETPA
jgi:acyl carrier protein